MWERSARFCPVCAGELAVRLLEETERRCCTQCTFVLYANPAAAAASVVLKGSEVLLIQRDIEPFKGHWTLPAGYEEYDETPVQTAERETREETGLEVRAFGLYDLLYTSDDPRKRGILAVYLCEPVGGTLAPGDDAAAARFFRVDDVPGAIGFANNRRVLERLRRELSAGHLRYSPIE